MEERFLKEKPLCLFPKDKLLEAFIDRYRYSALGTLVKGIVHNLNGSLQILSMRMEILQRMLAQDQGNTAQTARLNVEQCLDQIEQFRALIEVLMKKGIQDEQGGLQVIQIKELLEECLSLLYHNLFFKHHVKVVKNISAALPPIRARYSDLSLAFWNLIQNALESMEKAPARVLTLSADLDGDQIRVAVRDTGGGFSEEAKAHLFEPFFTTKKGRHPGLGLFTARFLLQACGASLEVCSLEGEATVTVYLPASPAQGV
jgi:signal transduction histidine kinase